MSRSSKSLNYLLPSAYFKVKGMKLHKYNGAPVGFRSEFFRWEERSGGPQDRFGLDAHLGQLVRLTEAIS